MKKALIAGAASAVLAAMPVVGVFADDPVDVTNGGVKDTVKLTVNKTCTMTAAAATNEIDLGNSTAPKAFDESDGSEMTITCNANAGWNLKATATALSNTSSASTIPFGAYQETTSVWSAKVALGGNNTSNAEIQNGFADYSATTANATIVAQNRSDAKGALPVSGLTITPSYKAYVQADQAQGTYSGTITYTLTDLTPAQEP